MIHTKLLAQLRHALPGALLVVPALAACSLAQTADAGPRLEVVLSDAGCTPSALTAPAGPLTIAVTNKSGKTAELAVLSGERITGEIQNIAPSSSKDLKLRLDGGEYGLACGARSGPMGKLVVTGDKAATVVPKANIDQNALRQVVTEYHGYLKQEAAALATSTQKLRAAIAANNIEAAREAYAEPRVHYGRIEPVAESFASLGIAIDGLPDDLPKGEGGPGWTGFHRIEKALFEDNSLDGMLPVANKLVADITELQKRINAEVVPVSAIAKGPQALIEAVSYDAITGEKERYSQFNLLIFRANIDGAEKIIELLRPQIQNADSALLKSIDGGFADVNRRLDQYKTVTGYQPYGNLTANDRKDLQTAVAQLAKDLSKLPGTLGTE